MKKNKLFLKLMIKNKNNLYSIIITLFILISFSFVFFELSANNALKNNYSLGYTPFTPLSMFFNVLDMIAFLVIALCSLTLIEVYKGFIEKNIKENSIFRASGYSDIRLSILYCFVFIVLCMLIIPIALLSGYILTCIVHFFLFKYLQIASSIYIVDSYIFSGIFILILALIIWITLFTMGYFYRKNLLELLNEARGERKENLPLIQVSVKIYLFVFFLGCLDIIMSLFDNALPVGGIIFVCLTLKKVNLYLVQRIKKFISKKDCINIVAIGESKDFLQKNSWFIYLYQISIIILSYVLIYMCSLQSDQIIDMLAYTICSIFLSSCLVYKYFLELHKSSYTYKYCYLLGYSNNQMLKIKKKIFNYIINFIFFIPLIFQIMLFFSQIFFNNKHMVSIVYILVLEFLIFCIVKIIVYRHSRHIRGESYEQ